jgi:hypothetical protein
MADGTPAEAAPLSDDMLRLYRTLAEYEVAAVPDQKLCVIFSCTVEDLTAVRASDEYKGLLAAEMDKALARARNIDEGWDEAEATAVRQLGQLLEHNTDIRVALGVAQRANQATRKMLPKNAVGRPGRGIDGAVIDPAEIAGQSRVVRIRTRFAEQLQAHNGVTRMVEREMEITTNDTGSLNEGMSPAVLKSVMQSALGVDMNDVAIVQRAPAHDNGLAGVLDFSQIDLEFPE